MDTTNIEYFMGGGISVAQLAAALFFLRFWRQTRDPFFAIFSLAFALLAGERIMLVALNTLYEQYTYVYVIRLVAFLLIIFAILQKNRRQTHD